MPAVVLIEIVARDTKALRPKEVSIRRGRAFDRFQPLQRADEPQPVHPDSPVRIGGSGGAVVAAIILSVREIVRRLLFGAKKAS
jgi:hypothetical protein